MIEETIQDFLSERKDGWLKKRLNASISDEDRCALEDEAEDLFSLNTWLPNAAKRAGQLSLVSHPSKFTHPSSKTNSIIAEIPGKSDGLLRSGNAKAALDVFGNAAAIDVYKFLSLKLSDNQTVLEHLEIESDRIKKIFTITSSSFEDLKNGFLSIKSNEQENVTSARVKQVYFPVEDGYHLLSLLTPSGLMFELRNRIQSMRFSDETKEARADKKNNRFNETGFDDLFNLAMIGFGGTKPQNISILNSTFGGKAYLIPSLPPSITKRKINLPKVDFFTNTLWPKNFEESFKAIHKLFRADYNNADIRNGISRRLQSVIDEIVEKVWMIRSFDSGWSSQESFSRLPSHQKIWLDNAYYDEREVDDDWLDNIISELARWLIVAYEKVMGRKAVESSDDELSHFEKIILENKEGLR